MQLGDFKRFVGFVRKGVLQYRFYVQMQGSDHTYLWTPMTLKHDLEKRNARYGQ